MEILIGILCALFVYIYIYREAIRKEKIIVELKNIIKTMDPSLQEMVLTSIKEFEKRITSLEIEVAKIKVKAGMYAGAFSALILFLFRIGEYLIFKK